MQFEFTEDLVAVRELAEKIFTERAQVERVRDVERAGGFDADLWRTIADAGLLAIAVPEEHGGAGLGMLGLAAVLEQQGRRVAAVPVWPVVAGAALPIARFGTDEQRQRWLPGILDGSRIVAGGFDAAPGQLSNLVAEASGDGWTVRGAIAAVPAAQHAAALAVPVRLPDGAVCVAIVPTDRNGVRLTPVDATDHLAAAAVSFDGVALAAEDLLGAAGEDAAGWTRRRIRVAMASLAIGVCSEAVAITAAYTSQREQFGRPLSTNQGVAIRAADAYLDTQNIRLTTYRAASLLDEGREEEAARAALVAKWWTSRAGVRVVLATQHLHGGIGADVDYPIHRYFLWGRQLAYSMGSAAEVEAELGSLLADLPALEQPA